MAEASKFTTLKDHIKEYAQQHIHLLTLNIYDKASKAISSIASALVFWMLIVFAVLFISLGCAWWIGQQLNNPFIGFLIIGGVYVIVTILVVANKDRWIRLPIINFFLKNITDEKD
jgi:hypothetical protein